MKFFLYILSFFIISCSSYNVKSYYDEFEHYEWFRYENNKVKEDYIGVDLEINPQKWVQGETEIYSLQIVLIGKEELEIDEGYSLLLSIDDQRVTLGNNSKKSIRNYISNSKIYEEAWFEIDKDILYNLAFSENIKFKINGKTEFIKGEFSDFNKKTFKVFYTNQIDNSILEIPSIANDLKKTKIAMKIPSFRKPETTLNNFYQILLNNGWNGEINEVDWDYHLDDVQFIQKININFETPVGTDIFFYPKFSVFEIIYSEQNKIPFVTKNEFQNYPCPKCPNGFPIDEFNFLFPELSDLDINGKENWSVFRKGSDIYLVVGEENKIQVDELVSYVIEYFQSETNTDIKLIKDRIQSEYNQKLDNHNAYKKIQSFLKENEYYFGEIDGLFGKESRIAFQKFLKSKEFYNGEINGERNLELSNSIKDYQQFLEIEPTGWINIEIAEKIMK